MFNFSRHRWLHSKLIKGDLRAFLFSGRQLFHDDFYFVHHLALQWALHLQLSNVPCSSSMNQSVLSIPIPKKPILITLIKDENEPPCLNLLYISSKVDIEWGILTKSI